MENNELKFTKTLKDAKLPHYDDLRVVFYSPKTFYLRYGSTQEVEVGVKLASKSHVIHIQPSTELAQRGVTILNTPLTIINGDIRLVLSSLDLEPVYISTGDVLCYGLVTANNYEVVPINPKKN